ncbi:hypothetical protein [Kiloniella antarctica]|uniref:Rad50/SbcC-type AAA domain-containing protein n=1 Tax=Kiloniella antarctica TaxID=1550907 RepID=A0ABW5BHE7_9PROT
MISEIMIKNIKGISNKTFKVQIQPNKPNILVAPNGFGKSSIATAFSSMNSSRLNLDEKDHHKEDISLLPELSVTLKGQKLTADQTKNDIRNEYDILVINSGLTPKAKKGFRGSVSSSLEVQSIQICKIPDKADFSYKVGDIRAAFGTNGKILPNISQLLKDTILPYVVEGIDFSKFSQKRIKNAIAAVKDKINERDGSSEAIKGWIGENCFADFEAISPLNELTELLRKLGKEISHVDSFLVTYQLAEIHVADTKKFKRAIEWLRYSSIKDHYDHLLSNFCSSGWQWAKINEDKKKKTLSIIFPKAHQLSNGQRDMITLVVRLHKTLYEGTKKPLILIIDEVFDYLDDANLVAFQYYVTSIIEAYKDRKQEIYPIILTHLDPGVFFDFCFNKHKIQVTYLLAGSTGKSKDTLKLIEVRDTNEQLKERLEKYWFHYHTDPDEFLGETWPGNLPDGWRSSNNFHAYTNSELERYLGSKKYDPLAVCFSVRVSIEKLAYVRLSQQDDQNEFIDNVRNTKKKINFVASKGADIPEIYFLLGLIYNTNLHWKQGRDYISPLVAKLNHPTIKQMIMTITDTSDQEE